MGRMMDGGQFAPLEQAEFDRLKKLVLDIIPDAEQVTSYGMPTFKYKNKVIFHVGAFADHMSIFPGAAAVAEFADQLNGYVTSKGTIQFSLDNPLPPKLVQDIITLRLKDIG